MGTVELMAQQPINSARNYRISWLATFLFFIAYYSLIISLPRYLTDLALPDWKIGFILGATSIASLLARPISGVLTDRIGYKRMLLFGSLSLMLGSIAVLFTNQTWILFILRVLQALGYVIFTTAGNALVGEFASPADRSTKIAYFGLAANFAMTMTPGATDLILPHIGLTTAFWLAGMIAITAGLLTRLLRFPPKRSSTAEQSPILIAKLWQFPRIIWLPMGVTALFGIGFGAYFQFFSVLLERREIPAAGVYAAYGLSIIATRLLFGRYLDRIGFGRILVAAAITMATGLGMAALGCSLPMMIISAALIATAAGFFHPALIAHHVTMLPGRPGWAVACFYFGFDFGIGIGAWVLGAVLDFGGLTSLFFTAAVFTLATLLLIPMLAKQHSAASSVDK